MSDYENEKTFAAMYLNDVYPLEAKPVEPLPEEGKDKVCIHCGPDCLHGAAHNARAEDGVIYEPNPTPAEPKLEYQKADNRMFSTMPEASFGTHIKEAVAIVKDWKLQPQPSSISTEPKRPKPQGGDYRPHYRKDEVDAYIERLEYERDVWRGKCEMLTKVKEKAAPAMHPKELLVRRPIGAAFPTEIIEKACDSFGFPVTEDIMQALTTLFNEFYMAGFDACQEKYEVEVARLKVELKRQVIDESHGQECQLRYEKTPGYGCTCKKSEGK